MRPPRKNRKQDRSQRFSLLLKELSSLPYLIIFSLIGILVFSAFVSDLEKLAFSLSGTGLELTIERVVDLDRDLSKSLE